MILALGGSQRRRSAIASLLRPSRGRAFEIRNIQGQNQIRLRNHLVALAGKIERMLHREN